jgi:septum formation protein
MNKTKIVLASSSKYRIKLLSRLRYTFTHTAPILDENKYKDGTLSPIELSKQLAELKAKSIESLFKDYLIIGSDQVCELDGVILSKPNSIDRAIEQLTMMNGKTHFLHTSVSLLYKNELINFTNTTTLKMRSLSNEEIVSYLKLDKPFDCAGSYKLEEHGISLFEEIISTDSSSIEGLPLIELNKKIQTIMDQK